MTPDTAPSHRRSGRRSQTAAERNRLYQTRADKLEALHERLAQEVASLRTGQDWQRWLTTAARFHTYSFNNVLLIHSQRLDATLVAGYEAWRALGRQVAKGERGIAVLAPVVGKRSSPDAMADTGADAAAEMASEPTDRRAVIRGFRVTYVWDISQTTGPPLPQQPVPRLLTGQAPNGLWDALAEQVADHGFVLERGDCASANGITDLSARTVRVRSDLDDAQAVKTLAHEVGHVLLHIRRDGDNPLALGCRGVVEVEAESVAYLVTAAHGLDAGGYTFPYVTGWASEVAGEKPEDVVRATGQRVVATARQIIERTLAPAAPAASTDITHQLSERADAAADRANALRAVAEAGRAEENPSHQASRGNEGVQRSPKRCTKASGEPSREDLLAVHQKALTFYRGHLDGSWVPAYLDSRALAAAIGEPWCAGYAPARWTALSDHLRSIGADDALLLASGLATTARTGRLIDRFRDRLMLPLRSEDGVIGFVGRTNPTTTDARVPRYLNSPETALYRKCEHLYGLLEGAQALGQGARPALVEGPLDAVAVTVGTGGRCAGLAACGTAFTCAHLARLGEAVDLRRSCVVAATDDDAPGRQAADRLLTLLNERRVTATAAVLTAGHDPAEALRLHGSAALTAALLDDAVPLADVVIERRIAGLGDRLRWVEGRVAALRQVASLVAALPNGDAARQSSRLAARLDLVPATVNREIASRLIGGRLSR